MPSSVKPKRTQPYRIMLSEDRADLFHEGITLQPNMIEKHQLFHEIFLGYANTNIE